MAKGLSELQKGLLSMALKNLYRTDGTREKSIEVWLGRDKNPLWAIKIGSLPHLTTHEALQGCTHAAARVSIARAFRRLVQRGLAERTEWSGIDLTLKGKETARELTVNIVRSSDDVNR